jgi:hypothetical protein
MARRAGLLQYKHLDNAAAITHLAGCSALFAHLIDGHLEFLGAPKVRLIEANEDCVAYVGPLDGLMWWLVTKGKASGEAARELWLWWWGVDYIFISLINFLKVFWITTLVWMVLHGQLTICLFHILVRGTLWDPKHLPWIHSLFLNYFFKPVFLRAGILHTSTWSCHSTTGKSL